MDPLLSVGSSAMGSWSLWDQTSSSSTFYEQLQAAASDSFSCPGGSGHSSSAPLDAGLQFQQQQQQQPHYHSQQPQQPQQQYEQQRHHLTSPPSASPFPGLGRPGMGLSSLGFSPVGPHLGQLPASASAASLEAEREMQQLLAAVASMATHDC